MIYWVCMTFFFQTNTIRLKLKKYFNDGWMHFFGLQNLNPHSLDTFYYNSDCIRLKEESHLHLGWLDGE